MLYPNFWDLPAQQNTINWSNTEETLRLSACSQYQFTDNSVLTLSSSPLPVLSPLLSASQPRLSLLPETNRQVKSDMCQMGARL